MTEQKARYFQYPLFLIRDLLKDKKKCLNNIMCYGIYHYAETKINIDKQNMYRQTIYDFYKGVLPESIQNRLNDYIDSKQLTYDDYYKGFCNGRFDPEREIEDLTSILEKDLDLFADIEQWYRIRQTFEFFGIEGDMLSTYNKGREIDRYATDIEQKHYPMFNKKLLFEYRDKEKSVYELEVLAVVCGMNSILGEGVFFPTNKNLIFSRAYGYDDINQLRADKHTAEEFNARWKVKDGELNEYRSNKILNHIEAGEWNLYRYSENMRGMYIAYKNKIEPKELIKMAITKKKTIKQIEKDRQQKIKEAKARAIEELRNQNKAG